MTQTPKRQSIWTPANIVTIIRICLVPVFVVALLSPWPTWFGIADLIDDQTKSLLAAIVFVIISCTDWIDGYLARSRQEVTDFGKFMDPLADKILVAAALLALIELKVLPSWPVLIILAREFIVSGIRMITATKGVVIAASWYGKAKTVLQIIAIVMFLLKDTLYPPHTTTPLQDPFYVASWIVMLVALLFTILSMIDYLSKAWPLISSHTPGPDQAAKCASASNDDALLEREAQALARDVVRQAVEKGLTVSTAESLTGGMISTFLTTVPGSSSAVIGGVVSYALSVKESLLGVDGNLLAREGAVDGDVARQMAAGVAALTGSNLAVAVTGIAGPGGAEPGKPVGCVYIGISSEGAAHSFREDFEGDRERIRLKTTIRSLEALRDCMKDIEGCSTIDDDGMKE